jgi:hypothetical protein
MMMRTQSRLRRAVASGMVLSLAACQTLLPSQPTSQLFATPRDGVRLNLMTGGKIDMNHAIFRNDSINGYALDSGGRQISIPMKSIRSAQSVPSSAAPAIMISLVLVGGLLVWFFSTIQIGFGSGQWIGGR